ncbi:hypothetical protein HDU77_006577 [Chytriomyces hyalinus]|nr:hypothetical protein HDU77_006577 [Chytriomyces hyalinus]
MSETTTAAWSVDLSDRPLYCISAIDAETAVVGGADHALSVLDTHRGRVSAILHSKQSGHAEWVTCVARLGRPGGAARVVSGAMDAKICVWTLSTSSVLSCVDLIGHSASVSCLSTSLLGPGIVASGSYDSTVRLWNTNNHQLGGTCVAVFSQSQAHAAALSAGDSNPVTDRFSSIKTRTNTASQTRLNLKPAPFPKPSTQRQRPPQSNAILGFLSASEGATETITTTKFVTHSKSGILHVFDVNSNSSTPFTAVQAHQGPISSLLLMERHAGGDVLVSSGLMDGAVRCFDLRVPDGQGRCVGKLESVHATGAGSTSAGITGMVALSQTREPEASSVGPAMQIVTTGGGGDGVLKVLEIRGGGKIRKLIQVTANLTKSKTNLGERGNTSISRVSRGGGNVPSASNESIPSASLPSRRQPKGLELESESGGGNRFIPPSDVAYALTSIPEVNGVCVSWGNGQTNVFRNVTLPGEYSKSVGRFPSNGNLEQVDMGIETLDTKSHGIKNALRCFAVQKVSGNKLVIVGAGDDGIAVAWTLRV